MGLIGKRKRLKTNISAYRPRDPTFRLNKGANNWVFAGSWLPAPPNTYLLLLQGEGGGSCSRNDHQHWLCTPLLAMEGSDDKLPVEARISITMQMVQFLHLSSSFLPHLPPLIWNQILLILLWLPTSIDHKCPSPLSHSTHSCSCLGMAFS